ncbi:hypothetical protein [Halomontanus rarus]|uniref:hypothetical protein n=1 Tax=Halomontanus rarus TaxID=3034020 RepID=UPI0023E7748F|nr:hypothetical protein [Halovivax sp. TS33]
MGERAPRGTGGEQLDALRADCEDQLKELEQQANLETENDTADEDNSIWTRVGRFVQVK